MTLREHLEAIRDRHARHDLGWGVVCAQCREPEPWPCPDYSDAVAALAILDAPLDASHWTIQRKPPRLPGEGRA